MSRVLIVDDEEGFASGLKYRLKSKYEVEIAQSPTQGLEQIVAFQPDVVLLDIMFWRKPVGLDVLSLIKEKDPTIEVIMMSCYAELPDVVAGKERGAFEFFIKPFEWEAFERAVGQAIARRQQRAAGMVREETRHVYTAYRARCRDVASVWPVWLVPGDHDWAARPARRRPTDLPPLLGVAVTVCLLTAA